MSVTADELAAAMQRWGFLEDPAPARRVTLDRRRFSKRTANGVTTVDDALPLVAALRAESCTIPALELGAAALARRAVLHRLGRAVRRRSARTARSSARSAILPAIADGVRHRRATTRSPRCAWRSPARAEGPPLELLFPLLGHDRILIRIGAVSSKLLHGRGLEPIAFGPDGAPFEPIRGQARPMPRPRTRRLTGRVILYRVCPAF